MPTTGERNDPYSAFNFLVTIDGVVDQAGFSEVSGLSIETDIIEYRTGGEDITVRKLPGLKKFSNIVLKRGVTPDTKLWEWRKQVLDGKTERHSGSITLLDEARKPAVEWAFGEAWPRKLDGPTFNGKTNEVAVETLELAVESVQVVVTQQPR
jgi:phage tail-like protein